MVSVFGLVDENKNNNAFFYDGVSFLPTD